MANSTPDISDIINTLSSNPALISTISKLVNSGAEHKSAPCEPPSKPCESLCAPKCKKYSKEIGLIKALCPFLSEERQRVAKTVIRVVELLESLECYI